MYKRQGYTYDYLKELERFTNFEFEFVVYDKEDVNDNIVEAMDDVAKGKVDIMGGMVYSCLLYTSRCL